MKWSTVFSSTKFPDPEGAVSLAIAAEEAGFDALWAPEHVVIPKKYDSEYAFASDKKVGEELPFPDPLIWLAFVASVTRRIKLGTGVVILPEHNPLLLAKSTATLHVLSGGRLMLGVGVGWLEEEFRALGASFEHRGPRAEEYIEAMRELWRNDVAEYHGRYLEFAPVMTFPKPPGRCVPVHIGGDSKVAARRAGRIGDGFFPALSPTERVRDELPALISEMRMAAMASERNPDDVEITSGGVRTAEAAKWYADLGVHRLTVPIRSRRLSDMREELMRFGSEVIEPTA